MQACKLNTSLDRFSGLVTCATTSTWMRGCSTFSVSVYSTHDLNRRRSPTSTYQPNHSHLLIALFWRVYLSKGQHWYMFLSPSDAYQVTLIILAICLGQKPVLDCFRISYKCTKRASGTHDMCIETISAYRPSEVHKIYFQEEGCDSTKHITCWKC
jgi:hypothetical protein